MTFSEVPFAQEIGNLSQALLNSLKLILVSITSTWEVDHREDGTHEQVRERGRETPMGDWITPTYVAADFTGNNNMTWTVDGADVLNLRYTLIGRSMTLAVFISSTVIAGTPSTRLMIRIPGGYLPAVRAVTGALVFENGAFSAGTMQTLTDSNVGYVFFTRGDGTAFAAGAASVFGTMTFEVTAD